ncbi:MAG: UDP-N-acetylglucosamine 2-epimerase [Paraglaciecola sp.]|uniref:UDP-N-acetylglucosamine 2-epimerase n=1 Tax=Paraglaciecola sp. TaxID=1920173 RepID=UPI0032664162
MKNKRVLFITGTRADFGKLKPLIKAVDESTNFDYQIFGTGMHTMAKYGNTILEIQRSGLSNLFTFINQTEGEDMEVILANTVIGLSRYLSENIFDLIVVHGDRVEALAGATVGALRNIRVAHVEGGEISGTVDELMRHAISKLSHLHFVATDTAKSRLEQLGEKAETVIKIGSPDSDILLGKSLPSIKEVRRRYQIDFPKFAIAMLHPVTTDIKNQALHAKVWRESMLATEDNYVLIYPNNDSGSQYIFDAINTLKEHPKFKIFPSLRFEYFLTLLKNAQYLIGNSSAGIHEAPMCGIPTINIGSRQHNRFTHSSIFNASFEIDAILKAHSTIANTISFEKTSHYGDGNSAEKFMSVLNSNAWLVSNQKTFQDLDLANV